MATCRCVHLGISYNITHTTDDLQNQRCKGLILLGIYPTGAAPYHSTQLNTALHSLSSTQTPPAQKKKMMVMMVMVMMVMVVMVMVVVMEMVMVVVRILPIAQAPHCLKPNLKIVLCPIPIPYRTTAPKCLSLKATYLYGSSPLTAYTGTSSYRYGASQSKPAVTLLQLPNHCCY